MKTAAEWFAEGQHHLGLSWSADTTSDLRGDRESAVAAFDQVLALEPNHLEALSERAYTLAALDEHEAALDSFVVATHLAPANLPLRFGAAKSLQALGRFEGALDACDSLLKAMPAHREGRVLRAELLSALERDELAVSAWDELLPTLADEGLTLNRGRLLRACSLARLGRPEARAAFLEVFRASFDKFSAGFRGNPISEALRQFAPAREAFFEFVEASGETLHAAAAEAWLAAQRPDEALAAADRWVHGSPLNSRAWFLLAEVHAASRRVPEALAAYDRSLALEPGFLGAQARRKVVATPLA